MKVFLLKHDRDVDWSADPPPQHRELTQDLDLATLFAAMAADEQYLGDIARQVVLAPLTEPGTILYRQGVLTDCLHHPAVVRQLYDLAVDALRSLKKVWVGALFRDSPDTILRRAVEILALLLDSLRGLRTLAYQEGAQFRSEGFTRFFAMVGEELDDDYLASIEAHLADLRLPGGVLMSAELGKGNKGVRHVLHRPPHRGWWERLTGFGGDGYSFEIHPRDEAGARALRQLEGQGVNLAANALAQSVDHVLSFFRVLRAELAFYLGCVNLHLRLADKGEPMCFPDPRPTGAPALSARGLYDVCLSLRIDSHAVGNDIDADGRRLVLITGANEGGKSTFLRSVGVAQLMMQSGMFVPATSFTANASTGVFTHFKREEDATMTQGKLDEELARMSQVADRIGPGALLLCNESFASTNEREGSEIARQVVRAATESEVKVLFVTHLYDLAHGLYRERGDTELFLRAERRSDGRRTFRMTTGEPLPTSYGADSYRRVFAGA